MKKIISLAIVCVMMLGMLSMVSFADTTYDLGNGITAKLSGTVLTVSGEGDLNYAGYTDNDVSTWPWHAEACTGDGCDAACPAQTVTKVVVGDGITGIKTARAFQNFDAMTEIEFGKNCASLAADCFSGCANLQTVTFNAAITSAGNGLAFGSGGPTTVNLTNQTEDDFKAVIGNSAYNLASNGGISTPLETATYTTKTVEVELDWPQTVTVTPKFGVIENWSGKTYLIWDLTDATNDSLDQIHAKLKDQTYKMKYVITDETAEKTYIIEEYYFDVGGEFGDWAAWYRVATGHYGITLEKDHAYTLAITITENGEVRYTGSSAQGAFVSTQEAFLTNGAITPDEVPHSYTEPSGGDPVDPDQPDTPVQPPKNGDATVFAVVFAAVAVLGMAVVVTKKVHA